MIYKILIVVLIIIAVISIVTLTHRIFIYNNERSKINTEDGYYKDWQMSKVKMKIEKGYLTKTSAKITITDSNEQPIHYGTSFRIDKKVKGKWSEWEHEEMFGFYDTAAIPEGGKIDITFNWKGKYKELTPGKYRFAQELGPNRELEYTIEFNF